jgi:opacity protein-like surface antigen
MKKILLVLSLIAVTSGLAFGQDDYKKGEVFVGFSNNQVDTDIERGTFDRRQSFNGFNASGVVNISRYVGLKADVSGTYRSDNFSVSVPNSPSLGTSTFSFDADSSLYNVLGGVQLKDNSSDAKVKPFAHALVGAGIGRIKVKNVNCPAGSNCSFLTANDESETGLAGAFGGGLDIKLSNRIDLRAVQVDYNPIRFDGGTQHNIRIGIGLVFK